MVYPQIQWFTYLVGGLEPWTFYDFPYAARVLVKNLKAWGPGPLKFLFLNAGKFTSQQAEGPSNS